MRVLFDWDAVVRNTHSGFHTFGTNLVAAMYDYMGKIEELHLTLLYQAKYHDVTTAFLEKAGLAHDQGNDRLNLASTRIKFRWIENCWNFLSFPSLESLAGSHDIYHCFHHFMPRAFAGKRLLTVHDLRRYRLPELYPASRLRPFEQAVERADHFIAVSESTKRDLCSIFGIPMEKVDVIHLACAKPKGIVQEQAEMIKKMVEDTLGCRDFILAISSNDRRKNIERIVEAYAQAKNESPIKMGLVIIGSIPREYATVCKMSGVMCIGEVEDVLSWMAASTMFVFASLYEGFGLPILESFFVGTPVITSNCSSMPEVAGDAALLVNPLDIRDIRDCILKLIKNKGLGKWLSMKGYERVESFNWDKTARKTIAVYKRLMSDYPSLASSS